MHKEIFCYPDTSSTRAEIVAASEKLGLDAVAIVGLGGTGSYILDLVAKTYVKTIHLFDGDRFKVHNAFRAPGAADRKTVEEEPNKAEYFREVYSKMRRHNICAYGNVDDSTVEKLREMDFVFLAAEFDCGRKVVAEKLEEYGVPFIDVGMGVSQTDSMLRGVLRVTTSVEESRDFAKTILPSPRKAEDNLYPRNIQIADLNALNAALAVIKWKKLFGFYSDYENEHNSKYLVSTNRMLNESRK